MDVYHGIPHDGKVPVLVRSTASGTVTVTVDGKTFSGVADTSVDDGLVLINVTGLAPDRKYAATIQTPNDVDSITIRTLPVSGEIRVGFHSCGLSTNKPPLWNYIKRDVHCAVNIGDEFYPEVQYNNFGLSPPSVRASLSNATDVDVYRQKHLQARRTPPLKAVLTSRGYARIPDDHDFGINDLVWDLSLAQLAMPFLTSYDDLRAVIDASGQAILEYDQINPVNSDPDVDTNPIYTRFEAGPHLEIFLISSVCAGIDNSASDRLVRPLNGDMLTAKEEAWLLDRLAKSTKTFKCVMSPKMTLVSEFHQEDFAEAEAGRVAQRDRILQAIHDNSPNWTVPGGCFWVSGDFHTPSVHAAYAGIDGETYDHFNVCACPAGSNTTNSGAPSKYARKIVNVGSTTGYPAQTPYLARLKNVGIITVPESGEYAQIEIVLANGGIWWSGRVYAGENKLTYPQTRVAIG